MSNNISPVLLVVWAALAACFLALIVYRGQLTRYEEDQLFLNENINQNEHQQQDDIVRRVNKLQPLVRICGGAVGAMTIGVVGLYVYNAAKLLM
ncbi:hypothetical protein SAMN05421770_10676 [Granulicella rosea]|uniref:Uncharacterized protein n=1 Tax=Granulicella rosea TaxID=474952 RepID=A0A239L3H0_9BACT|nr:hypothetical protein [Granulicella rosea]SNT24885.1 hypothetical protein SAMN05421770_10676 [Granulicella rosea]